MPAKQFANHRNSTKGVLLCIDDMPPLLESLRFVLEQYGYSVLVSPDATHGLKLFQTMDIDLVIVDHEMPVMSGHQVALEMKRIKPEVPIILHSGCVELSVDALNAVDAFVPKGLSFLPLVAEVAQIMASRENLPE